MKLNKKIIIVLLFIIGIAGLIVGSIAYYRIVVSGSIEGSTGNAVFVLRDTEAGESWNNKVISLGQINPGDSGSFDVVMDASGSTVDMYATLTIDRGDSSNNTELPTNLKFYTTSDHQSELHKYYSFLEKSRTNKETLTIYWYWNPYIDDLEDTKYINKSFNASINVSAVQISEYAMMKNGSRATYDEETGNEITSVSAFWQDAYKPYIRTISFGNDLSNLPSSCTEENLCFDISDTGSKKKVYAYLIDSGLKDEYETEQSLYNLYIVSGAPIFAPVDSSYLFAGFSNIKSINFNNNFNTSKVTDMSYMFGSGYYRSSIGSIIQNLDLSTFNTSNVINMEGMFLGYRGLLNLNIDNFNTSKVTNMAGMFSMNSSLKKLDLSSFCTMNVITFGINSVSYGMFYGCSSLEEIDLSSFDTSSATGMYGMFCGWSSIKNLELSNFNTSNVTSMRYMFSDCSSLEEIDLSSFNTSHVTDMSYMFETCSSLTSLDLSNFNTSSVNNMNYMFSDCSSLESLNLNGFNKIEGSSSNNNIFSNCTSLKYLDISNCYFEAKINTALDSLSDSSYLITTINLYSTSNYKFQFFNPSNGKITINYTSNIENDLDNSINNNSNWVKGKLITAPTSS